MTAVAILGAAIAMPARSTRAEPAATDCLTEPTGAAPPGSHWYYRTDRSTGTRCWHLKPRRDKGQEELAVGTPRPSSGPIAEPKVAPPAIAGVAKPVAEVPTLQSVWAAAAPIAAEPPSSIEQGAAEQSQMQPPHEQERQADEPSATAVLSVAAQPADDISNTRLVTLALVAAVLALAAVIALKVFQLLFVRWLQRRRSALRRQGRAASWRARLSRPSLTAPLTLPKSKRTCGCCFAIWRRAAEQGPAVGGQPQLRSSHAAHAAPSNKDQRPPKWCDDCLLLRPPAVGALRASSRAARYLGAILVCGRFSTAGLDVDDRGEQRGGHGKRQHIGYIALHLTEARCRSWAHPPR